MITVNMWNEAIQSYLYYVLILKNMLVYFVSKNKKCLCHAKRFKFRLFFLAT